MGERDLHNCRLEIVADNVVVEPFFERLQLKSSVPHGEAVTAQKFSIAPQSVFRRAGGERYQRFVAFDDLFGFCFGHDISDRGVTALYHEMCGTALFLLTVDVH